ncbi:hypothetical protein V8E36_003171 [Tilletia maclaganii]
MFIAVTATAFVHATLAIYSEQRTQKLVDEHSLPPLRDDALLSGDQAQRESGASSIFGDFSSFFSPTLSSSIPGSSSWQRVRLQAQLDNAHAHSIAARLGKRLRGLLDTLNFLPHEVQVQVGRAYTAVSQSYLDLTPAQRAVVPILALNTLVFLAFRLPSTRVQAFMYRHFTHVPVSRRYHTMVTSAFAHRDVLHFAINSFVIWSFSGSFIVDPNFREGRGHFNFSFSGDDKGRHAPSQWYRSDVSTREIESSPSTWNEIVTWLYGSRPSSDPNVPPHWTPEASPTPHFLAFWITAALYSSLGKQFWAWSCYQYARIALRRALTRHAQLRSVGAGIGLQTSSARSAADVAQKLATLRAVGSRPGLGASGAAYATVAASCTCHPEEKINLFFLPDFDYPAQTVITGALTFEAVCLLLGQLNSPVGNAVRGLGLDHAVHISGMAYGIWYASRAPPTVKDSTKAEGGPKRVPEMAQGLIEWERCRLLRARMSHPSQTL